MASTKSQDQMKFKRLRDLHNPKVDKGSAGAMNMGTVLMEREDGMLCVRKTIGQDDVNDGTALREVSMLDKLKYHRNPYINAYVKAERVGQRPNMSVYLYIKYCDLGGLDGVIRKYFEARQPIPEEFCWHVFRSLAKALALCHFGINEVKSRQAMPDFNYILHGDMKPANVFLSRHPGHTYPLVVLGDFGCGWTRNQLNNKETVGGGRMADRLTPCFAPPESDFDNGPKSDVFGLALTIMIMIGARPPGNAPKLHLDTWDQQMDALDRVNYSPYLKEIITMACALEKPSRLDSMSLVNEINVYYRSALKDGYIVPEDQAPRIPKWALTKDTERQPDWVASGKSRVSQPQASRPQLSRPQNSRRTEQIKTLGRTQSMPPNMPSSQHQDVPPKPMSKRVRTLNEELYSRNAPQSRSEDAGPMGNQRTAKGTQGRGRDSSRRQETSLKDQVRTVLGI